MLNNFIKEYVNKLTKDDIVNFALKENINLTNNETEIILKYLKKYQNTLIDDRYLILDKIKDKLQPTTYLKMKELLSFYERKYSIYL